MVPAMSGRSGMERAIKDLHGSDAEIIELDAEGEPSGRRYRVVKPEPELPWPWMPMWLRLMFGLLAFSILIPLLVVLLGGLVFALWMIWTAVKIWMG
jgi:hypothetical protein